MCVQLERAGVDAAVVLYPLVCLVQDRFHRSQGLRTLQVPMVEPLSAPVILP